MNRGNVFSFVHRFLCSFVPSFVREFVQTTVEWKRLSWAIQVGGRIPTPQCRVIKPPVYKH